MTSVTKIIQYTILGCCLLGGCVFFVVFMKNNKSTAGQNQGMPGVAGGAGYGNGNPTYRANAAGNPGAPPPGYPTSPYGI